MRRLIWCRRETPEIGWGTATLIETASAGLFAQRVDWQGSTVVTVHNLGEEEAEAELELGDDVKGVDDLLELREHQLRQRPPAGEARPLRLPVAARAPRASERCPEPRRVF